METNTTGTRFNISYIGTNDSLNLLLGTLPELGVKITTLQPKVVGSFLGFETIKNTITFEIYTENAICNVAHLLGVKYNPSSNKYDINL